MKPFLISAGVFVATCVNTFPLLAIAEVMSDEDREMIEMLYYQYRSLMYHVARKYFADKPEELDDIISTSLERMCRYSARIREVPGNKIQAYVVLIVENTCRERIREIAKERRLKMVSYDGAQFQKQEKAVIDTTEMLFDHADARSLLSSFKGLSQRDRDIIWMRHVEQLEYAEIARTLDMKEGAVRTALTRAKAKLEKAVREGGCIDAH